MIIWRRSGFVVLFIFLISQVATEWIINSLFGAYYFDSYFWPQVLAVVLCTIFTGIAGYLLNYKYRKKVVHEETGKIIKSPSHSFFFIPVEFWAILIPVIGFLVIQDNYETLNKDMRYLSSPSLNDKYLMNYEILMNDYRDEAKYGMGIVTAIDEEKIVVKLGNSVYNKTSGPKKDMKEFAFNRNDYFSEQAAAFTTSELIDFRRKQGIYGVIR
jgi:hypothetical protein